MVPERMFEGRTVQGPASARLDVDGEMLLNFYGSGYLALSGVDEIRNAVRALLDAGAPFAQHVPPAFGAHDPTFADTETEAARGLGREASVYFASGHLIGQIGLLSMAQGFDAIFIDEHAHYNLQDAAKLSGVAVTPFAHREAGALSDCLRRSNAHAPLVLTDGVFATTGQLAPLDLYAALLSERNGRLFVDDSHGFGVIGAQGRGAVEFLDVASSASVGATLSKALCAQGAVIGCSSETARHLKSMPPLRGATIGSPLSAAAARASLAFVARRPELRAELLAKSQSLRARLSALGLDVIASFTPIVAFRHGDFACMEALQKRALAQGIVIQHSTYVGAGPEGVIRCAVFRDHSDADFECLADFLRGAL
jgi:8-amino-7-oxononanoate synthase